MSGASQRPPSPHMATVTPYVQDVQARGENTLLSERPGKKADAVSPSSMNTGDRSVEDIPICSDELSPHLTDPISSLFGIMKNIWVGNACAPDDSEKSQEEEASGSAACLVSIKGLSYVSVRANRGLLERCEAAVVDAIGADPEGLALHAMVVEVLGGMHATHFAMAFPDYVTQQELQIHLTRALNLGKLIETRISAIQGVDAALARGAVACELSGASAEGLVRFQGTWIKDSSTYLIRGSGIRFPSGGRAEMISHDHQKFSITHPSGVSFNAVLENNGLELRWTNGSTWSRSFGREQSEPPAVTVVPVSPPHREVSSHDGHSHRGETTCTEGSSDTPADLAALACEVGPAYWGITGKQCRDLLDELRLDPLWTSEGSVTDMIDSFIVPRTEAAHIGYSLLVNHEEPLLVTSLVLHAPDAKGEEVLATVARSADDKEVFFIASLCKRQVRGGTMEEEEYPPEDEMKVLHQIQEQRRSQWCSRWCCGPLWWLPRFLVALAVLIFYAPIISYGCVPAPDFSRCGARVPLEDLSWASSVLWRWQPQYQEHWELLPEESHLFRSFTYAAVGGLLLIAASQWILHFRFRPSGGRVLVIPGHGSHLKNRHDFGIGHGPSMLALDADNLQVPVVFAPGVTAPKHVRRPRPPAKKAGDAGAGDEEDDVGEDSEARPVSSMDVIAEEAMENADASHYEEKPQERVLRIAARRRRWAQSRVVVSWAFLLLVLRVADLSLALAGTWLWQDAVCALAGVVLGVFASVTVLHCMVRSWHGRLPLWTACTFPGGLLLLGAGVLALLTYLGLLMSELPSTDRWMGMLDLATDEAARYIDSQECGSLLCKRSVAIAASFAQTLLVAGVAVIVAALSSLICCRRCKRLSHPLQSLIAISLALVASVTLAFVRSAYVAGGLTDSDKELPQAEFAFSVGVYLLTQAIARCAAPVCLLFRLCSLWGVSTVRPRCCRRRRSSVKQLG